MPSDRSGFRFPWRLALPTNLIITKSRSVIRLIQDLTSFLSFLYVSRDDFPWSAGLSRPEPRVRRRKAY